MGSIRIERRHAIIAFADAAKFYIETTNRTMRPGTIGKIPDIFGNFSYFIPLKTLYYARQPGTDENR